MSQNCTQSLCRAVEFRKQAHYIVMPNLDAKSIASCECQVYNTNII